LLRPHLSLPQLGRIARIGEWSSIYSGWCPYIIIFILYTHDRCLDIHPYPYI
jgi:hypothetical protein